MIEKNTIPTDEIIKSINSSHITSLSTFLNRAQKMIPGIHSVTLVNKVNYKTAGILATAQFTYNSDIIHVRGFLHTLNNWSEETHGYVTASKVNN